MKKLIIFSLFILTTSVVSALDFGTLKSLFEKVKFGAQENAVSPVFIPRNNFGTGSSLKDLLTKVQSKQGQSTGVVPHIASSDLSSNCDGVKGSTKRLCYWSEKDNFAFSDEPGKKFSADKFLLFKVLNEKGESIFIRVRADKIDGPLAETVVAEIESKRPVCLIQTPTTAINNFTTGTPSQGVDKVSCVEHSDCGLVKKDVLRKNLLKLDGKNDGAYFEFKNGKNDFWALSIGPQCKLKK